VRNSIPGRGPLLTIGGRLLCIDRNENVINIHDLEKSGNALVQSLKGHDAIINAITAVNDGNRLVTGAGDKSVIVWNLENFNQEGKVDLEGYVNALASTPDGNTVYAAGENKFIVCFML